MQLVLKRGDPMNLNEQAYDYLKSMILSGKLSPGVLYSETKIASEIGISRTPMREAIVRLSQEGLLDIQHSKGFFLHILTADDLRDMFQMRLALEGYALIQLAKNASEPEACDRIAQLERNLEEQYALIGSERDLNKLVQKDREFHTIMISYMHNHTLETLYQNQVYRIQSFARRSFDNEGRIGQTVEEHARIVDALRRRDPAAAYRAASDHLDNLVSLMSVMIADDGLSSSPFSRQQKFRSGSLLGSLNLL